MAGKIIVVHDTEYEMDQFYINGAMAMRSNIPYDANPHLYGSQRYESWSNGHTNESAGEHIRFGYDLLNKEIKISRFEMDPEVPRTKHGDVDSEWYSHAINGNILSFLDDGSDLTGREVEYFGDIWTISGKNYLGDWVVTRLAKKQDGQNVKQESSISKFLLPETHPHFAKLLPIKRNKSLSM